MTSTSHPSKSRTGTDTAALLIKRPRRPAKRHHEAAIQAEVRRLIKLSAPRMDAVARAASVRQTSLG